MIRVSIGLPSGQKYRMKPLVDNAKLFLNRDVLLDFDLPNPDLRILHNDIAVQELLGNPDRRLRTPTIVYERVDGAGVIGSDLVRRLMANPDVKLWLKRNSYRDFELNNRNRINDNLHYKTLNDLEKLSVAPSSGETPLVPITGDMATKIRFLPVAYIDRFAALREASIDWSEKRQIDVNFAGTVDYEVQARDYWDEAFDKAQRATSTELGSVVIRHRREAVRQLIELRHLRIVIGTNGAVGVGMYLPMMLQSSIAVSPWGLGEYSYRDYEAILAGAVLVKPDSGHIATFAPDIYQAGKYYAPCAADFSDLRDVICTIMSHRDRSIEMAQRARAGLLAENRPEQVAEYFVGLFREALN